MCSVGSMLACSLLKQEDEAQNRTKWSFFLLFVYAKCSHDWLHELTIQEVIQTDEASTIILEFCTIEQTVLKNFREKWLRDVLALLRSWVAVVGMPNNVATSSSGAWTFTSQKAEFSFAYISTMSVSNLEWIKRTLPNRVCEWNVSIGCKRLFSGWLGSDQRYLGKRESADETLN